MKTSLTAEQSEQWKPDFTGYSIWAVLGQLLSNSLPWQKCLDRLETGGLFIARPAQARIMKVMHLSL